MHHSKWYHRAFSDTITLGAFTATLSCIGTRGPYPRSCLPSWMLPWTRFSIITGCLALESGRGRVKLLELDDNWHNQKYTELLLQEFKLQELQLNILLAVLVKTDIWGHVKTDIVWGHVILITSKMNLDLITNILLLGKSSRRLFHTAKHRIFFYTHTLATKDLSFWL